jgi:hypothetical protein
MREHAGEYALAVGHEFRNVSGIQEIRRELHDIDPAGADRSERGLDIGKNLDALRSKSSTPTMLPALSVATWPAIKANSDARTQAIWEYCPSRRPNVGGLKIVMSGNRASCVSLSTERASLTNSTEAVIGKTALE